MRKIKAVLLAFTLSICCLTACGGDNPLLTGGGSSGSSEQAQAQTFTITYVVTEGGTMEGEVAQEVTLNASYELNSLTRSGYQGYWTYEGEKIAFTGVWEIAENVTLTSAWEKVKTPSDGGWTDIY